MCFNFFENKMSQTGIYFKLTFIASFEGGNELNLISSAEN